MNILWLAVNMASPKARQVLELIANHCEFGSVPDYQTAVYDISNHDILAVGGPKDDPMETMRPLGTITITQTPAEIAEQLCATPRERIKELYDLVEDVAKSLPPKSK